MTRTLTILCALAVAGGLSACVGGGDTRSASQLIADISRGDDNDRNSDDD